MKLLIKQRIFSWSDSYDVYDEYGSVKYFVKAKVFAFGHQLHVYDSQGNEVGAVHEQLFSMLPKFEIETGGRMRGRILKCFSLFRPRYDVEFNGWSVEGDFMGWDYDVCENGRSILHISKELLHWGDTYVLDFERPEDELMGLLLVIAIDAANCSENN